MATFSGGPLPCYQEAHVVRPTEFSHSVKRVFGSCVFKFGCFQVRVGLLSPVGVPYPVVFGGFQVRVGPQCPGTIKIGSLVARTQRECSNCNLLLGYLP